MASVRGRSYWCRRRDIAHSVDSHVNELMEQSDYTGCDMYDSNIEQDAAAVCESNIDVCDVCETPEDLHGNENDYYCESDVCEDSDNDTDSSSCRSNDYSDENLAKLLAVWATDFNVPQTAVTALLHLLSSYHPGLPLTAKTLLQTVQNVEMVYFEDGSTYSHIGILKKLQQIFETISGDPCFSSDRLSIQVNVDGIPLYKSSNIQLWPILGILKGTTVEKPFTIGVYAGSHKPRNMAEFLHDFIDEFKQMQSSGFVLGDKMYHLSVHSFVCDAPARALLKQTKLHCGYYGCERCEQKGEWCNKVIFPATDAAPRTDVRFDELADEHHHIGKSPLRELGIGFVSQFCLDYMHLICLGVTRKLLMLWMRGPLNTRLSVGLLNQISERLINLRHAVPSEFARRPRTVLEVDRWKATEFRSFLLYTGPVVLRGLLPEPLYNHFMLLSASVYCCLNSVTGKHYLNFVRSSLIQFVKLASEIYGKDVLVYNMHSIIHIVEDVARFGPLDTISCFPFENHLRLLKKMVRKAEMPLQQIVRRVSEQNAWKSFAPLSVANFDNAKHENGPVPDAVKSLPNVTQYQKLNVLGFTLSSSVKDGVILLTNGDVAVVQNILVSQSGIYIVCQKFLRKRSLYEYPLPSREINVYIVSRLCSEMTTVLHTAVAKKCVCVPTRHDKEFAVLPFPHIEQ